MPVAPVYFRCAGVTKTRRHEDGHEDFLPWWLSSCPGDFVTPLSRGPRWVRFAYSVVKERRRHPDQKGKTGDCLYPSRARCAKSTTVAQRLGKARAFRGQTFDGNLL